MSKFTHLHLHTEYSLLDGANRLKKLAKKLKECNMDSVAMTDHGCMFGTIDFYLTMLEEGIKPIIGIETYIHNNDDLGAKENVRFHLCLFAKNHIGYKNLMYLSSQAYIHGFYRNPRINKKLLREYKEGLICSSACLQGEVNYHLNEAKAGLGYEYAKQVALEYKEIFGEDFYLEIMRHGIREQRLIDDNILRLGKETGIKVIATNDAHYTNKKDAFYQDVAMCISTGKKLNDTNRLKHSVEEFYVKSPEEMQRIFADIPEVLENTQEIVEKCNLIIDIKSTELKDKDGNIIIPYTAPSAPSFKSTHEYALKEGLDCNDDEVYFRHKCTEGLKERLRNIDESEHEIYKKRLEYEMDIISQMKFAGYMLIVWDFVREAKERNIPVGPGRGSAAGSLVAFCLNITNVDPIKHHLLFERFLNPERVSMPDIDIDFCQERRGEIVDYVKHKYGENHVAQVITFNEMLAKQVVRDVTRVFDIEYVKADKFAKLIPNELKIKLKEAYEKEPKISEIVNSTKEWRDIWDTSLALENQKRNAGIHAAAIVIDSEEELWNKIPLCVIKDKVATQYSNKDECLEKINLIKFDFLGLKTLTVIHKTLELIDKDIDFNNVDLDDPQVYKTIQSGDTIGLFQLESKGMRALNRRMNTHNFDDLAITIALFRPGAMKQIDIFFEYKNGEKNIQYPFKELDEILKSTYGVIVYQEQVMQIVQTIGGFSLGEADIMRRAMGKKKLEYMLKLKKEFSDGAESRGFDRKKTEDLWELIVAFAGYGFNKSHAVAYAMLAFQTAYLKTYYKYEFMAALLSSEDKVDNINKYIQECRNMKIEVLPPHVNSSQKDFSVVEVNGEKKIVFGLNAIKGIGEKPIETILEARKKGAFKSIDDFIGKMEAKTINKRVLESLIKSGALRDLGYSTKSLINNIDLLADTIRANTKAIEMMNDEQSLFKDFDMPSNVKLTFKNEKEHTKEELLEFEYEMLGIFMSGNPLDKYSDKLDNIPALVFGYQIQDLRDDSKALIVGIIKEIKEKISKKGNRYAEMLIVDKTGNVEIQVTEKHLKDIQDAPKNKPLCFRCHASSRNGNNQEDFVSLRLEKVMSLDSGAKEDCIPIFKEKEENYFTESTFYITIPSDMNLELLKQIQQIAAQNAGNEHLVLCVTQNGIKYEMHSPYMINDEFKTKIQNLGLRAV